VRVPLAAVATSGTSQTSGTVTARLTNPSARLICSWSVSFEPNAPVLITSYGSATWTLTAARPGGVAGRRAALHALETAVALPTMYEIAGGIREVDVSCALALPTPTVAGSWVLQADWEPTVLICDAELAEIYSRCTAVLTRGLTAPLAP
jgi:hypothetical protein